LGEALVDPATSLEVTPNRAVTDFELLLGEMITNEVYGPSRFEIANVTRALLKQAVEVLIERLAFGGRSSGFGGVIKPGDAVTLVGFEPGAHGLLIAIESVRNLWDTELLGAE
jgi:hypothetical protein